MCSTAAFIPQASQMRQRHSPALRPQHSGVRVGIVGLGLMGGSLALALRRDEPAVTDLVRAVGAEPRFMDAERHDRLVADVSHAAFLVSAAYVLALSSGGEWEDLKRVAGPGFRDMSRLAAGDPEFYSAI